MNKKSKNDNRYLGISICSAILLLLLVAILGLNLYGHSRSQENYSVFNESSRLRDISNDIHAQLSRARSAFRKDHNLFKQKTAIQKVAADIRTLENGLQVLSTGGKIDDVSGTVVVEALTNKLEKSHVDDAIKAIQPMQSAITNYLNSMITLQKVENYQPYDKALMRVSRSNLYVLKKLDDFSRMARLRGIEQYNRLHQLQFVFIVATLLFYLAAVFYFSRRLLVINTKADKSLSEIDEIMSTVNEGLFLINEDLKIAGQYSRKLESLLGQKEIAGRNLDEVLEPIVAKKDLDTTVEFIGQLYNPRVKEKLIKDLNPLDYLEVQLTDKNGNFYNRFLSFNFSRVYEKEKIKRVLVSINDITNTVLLEQQLERQQEQSAQQLELLTSIMHADPYMLHTFINHTHHSTDRINEILRRPENQHADLYVKTQDIFREVHSLKGEASALELEEFVLLTSNFEDSITQLQKKRKLSGNDFLPLAVNLEKIIEQVTRVDMLVKHFGKITEAYHEKSGQHVCADKKPVLQDTPQLTEVEGIPDNQVAESVQQVAAPSFSHNHTDALTNYFNKYVNNIASRNGKSVLLETRGLDDLSQDMHFSERLSDIIIQLVRNAVVHGIETPEQRKAKGKDEHGTVRISFLRAKGNNMAELVIGDDGGGIDYGKIRKKLVDISLCDVQTAKSLSRKQLIALLFDSGFSTISRVNEDAGRGVGLDVIKERVEKLQGRIKIDSKKDSHTRFIIRIPLGEKE